jgi:copper chaperone CopZ
MKNLLIIIALLLCKFTYAQSDTVRIKTVAVCEMCKETIEHDLSFVKGVEKSTLDLKANVITVVYDSKKTNPDKIRTEISRSGYDADSVKADPKAVNKLPACCRGPHNE